VEAKRKYSTATAPHILFCPAAFADIPTIP
jgi:hypothetical protein